MLSKLVNILENLNACHKSIKWLSGVDNIQQAWEQCERGDWMLWVLANLKADRKKVVLSACGCARLSLRFNPDERVLHAIETAEAWTAGKATLADLDRATWAVEAAAEAAGAAVKAAWASEVVEAAWAAGASEAAAWAAVKAAGAAAEAFEAATWAAEAFGAAAREDTLKQCADIVRLHFSLNEVSVLVS